MKCKRRIVLWAGASKVWQLLSRITLCIIILVSIDIGLVLIYSVVHI